MKSNLTFYKGSHLKGLKQRALHVHQRKTKHFIAKLFAQPYMLLNTLSILVGKSLKNGTSQVGSKGWDWWVGSIQDPWYAWLHPRAARSALLWRVRCYRSNSHHYKVWHFWKILEKTRFDFIAQTRFKIAINFQKVGSFIISPSRTASSLTGMQGTWLFSESPVLLEDLFIFDQI